MKKKKIKNWFKKIVYLQIGFLLFISCANEKKSKNNLAFLAALLNKSSTSSSKDTNVKKEPKKPIELNITDPLYKDQWYLKNKDAKAKLQKGGETPIDINVEPVWKQGFLGKGVKIGILDSLVDSKHPDLKDNLPSSNIMNTLSNSLCSNGKSEYHGTSVAGIIASKDNKIGTRGIAPHATLYSYAVIPSFKGSGWNHLGEMLKAFNRSEKNDIAVYNGSLTDGAESEYYIQTNTTETAVLKAFDEVTQTGFGGLGASLVFAAGNEQYVGGNTASNDFLNHYATIVVNSIGSNGKLPILAANKGQQTAQANLLPAQTGPNLWLIAPGGAAFGPKSTKITTTSVKCKASDSLWSHTFNGTSSAAPMVTGVIALLREAFPKLTWRDIKLILAESAKKIAIDTDKFFDWQQTGKMYSDPSKNQSYQRSQGFGLIDASAAFNLAKNWKLLPPMKTETFEKNEILNTRTDDILHVSNLNIRDSKIKFIESVVIDMEISRTAERIMNYYWTLSLVSPDNKIGWIYRELDELDDRVFIDRGITKLRFSMNAFLGSSVVNGTWKLRLQTSSKTFNNAGNIKNEGKIEEIKNWKITIRGH